MNINTLIFRNLKKNIKNYYLYVFALIFSASLYFSFVTLQYDPSLDEAAASVKGAAGIRAASILLIGIVSIFLLYANTIFIKRRGKEIGLFQLIGMTRGKIFRILLAENAILYLGSILVGIFVGFAFSKLILMILFKIIDVEAVAELHFSSEAFIQTLVVFCLVFLLIVFMNMLFIKKQSILSLFRVTSSTEGRVKKLSFWDVLIGIAGIGSIIGGYYLSSKLFDGDFTSINALFFMMITILGLVIIGTYLFYKGSVSLLSNMIRKRKKGYLSIKEVLSLSSIMFRMKSNSVLLTIITTVSALAIALLSLSYISYYSAEKSATESMPDHFSFDSKEIADSFQQAIETEHLAFTSKIIPIIWVMADIEGVLETIPKGFTLDPKEVTVPIISEEDVDGIDVAENEVIFSGYNSTIKSFMPIKDSGNFSIVLKNKSIPLHFNEVQEATILSYNFTSGGLPVAIVDKNLFANIETLKDAAVQENSNIYYGFSLHKEKDVEKANDIFHKMDEKDFKGLSRLDLIQSQKEIMGLAMFIVGFLGLTFLITSGCILYFKQMDEGEEEKFNYTILRKLGYTQGDLLSGIKIKQYINFGIPLAVGLLHSYFAVQSGWFFFGTELWTPMFIVMGLYAILYSIFGVLSVLHYKKLIREAL